MSKRPHPEQNGNGKTYYYLEEVNLSNGQVKPKKRLGVLPWVVVGSIIALGVAISLQFPLSRSLLTQSAPNEVDGDEVFRQAVNKAMSAAEQTQTANYKEDWNTVAGLWQDAIRLMQAVPSSSNNYPLAQQKVGEYQRNLQYAKSNVQTRPRRSPQTVEFWSVGSSRGDVIAVQGTPTRVERTDAKCEELLYYGNSVITLQHGMVSEYDNVDNNLNVSVDPSLVYGTLAEQDLWTLGSPRDNLFQVQGTPTRINTYTSLNREVAYYGESMVEITNGFVTGYSDFDDNLKVSVSSLVSETSSDATAWSLGALESEVYDVQGTPSQIRRYDSLCRAVLHYGDSTINFENGRVAGYDNVDGNLRVK
jgi:hypothetical protein